MNNSNHEKVLQETIETIEEYAKKSYKLINKYKSIKYFEISKEQQEEHDNINVCNDCKSTCTKDNKKCIHHDHITGKYISSICNN